MNTQLLSYKLWIVFNKWDDSEGMYSCHLLLSSEIFREPNSMKLTKDLITYKTFL